MEQNNFRWLVLGVVVVGFIALCYFFVRIDMMGVKCMTNPFVFGAKEISAREDSGIKCSCRTKDKMYSWSNDSYEVVNAMDSFQIDFDSLQIAE